MQIDTLFEGNFTIDASKQFIPFDDTLHTLQQRAKGSLLLAIQPFVVRTMHDVILIDTGLGGYLNNVLQLHINLQQHDIAPTQITKVLISHLHVDHIGGIMQRYNDNYKLAFPNATYYIQKKEFEAARYTKNNIWRAQLEQLSQLPQIVFLEGDGKIGSTIQYELTSGHAQFHQVFWIRENGKCVFYGGDDAATLGSIQRKFTAKYDFDGTKSRALRELWYEQGKKENWTFLFYHDAQYPIVSL